MFMERYQITEKGLKIAKAYQKLSLSFENNFIKQKSTEIMYKRLDELDRIICPVCGFWSLSKEKCSCKES